ncbi:1-aminocyclopropane-1-carboxylate synthase 6 isoform X2 [Physcomitrium patens]
MGSVMGGRVELEPSQMVLTAGATPTLEILAFSLAQPGEAFLVPSPYYAGFDRDIKWRSQVELIPVPCSSDTDFKLTPDVLESTFRRMSRKGIKIRGVLISNPSNPVGNVLDRAALTSLLAFTQDKKIHLLVDEIYAACTHEEYAFTSITEILDTPKSHYNRSYVHIIYGLSKDLGIAGFRVGVLYSWHKQVLEAASRMARYCAVSTATQQLCTSLLSDEQFMSMFLFENRRRITKRYRKVVAELNKIGIQSKNSMGGLFCWIDLRHVLASPSKDEEMKLWKHLLYKVGLHLTPGTSCWCEEPGWFRLCFATVDNETLMVAFLRFQKFMQNSVY